MISGSEPTTRRNPEMRPSTAGAPILGIALTKAQEHRF
jgi:hypothetical protein